MLYEVITDLTDARNARRPSQTKIDRLEKEIAGLKDKINELEPPLLAKRKEVEDMKKAARVSYCGVYGDKSKEEITPTVKVTANGVITSYSIHYTKLYDLDELLEELQMTNDK